MSVQDSIQWASLHMYQYVYSMVMFESDHRAKSVPLGNQKCLVKWLNGVLMRWSGSLVR